MAQDSDVPELLEKHLMRFYPERFLPNHVRTARDLFDNRRFVREFACDEFALKYLLDVIIEAVQDGERFRTLDCLRVIRDIVKRRPSELQLGCRTLDRLFFLYRAFIFHRNADVRWCVSWFVKDQVLDDDKIRWLISNYKKSKHVVDRLLLHPCRHPLITDWAAKVWEAGEFRDRRSQVIGLLISDDIPPFVGETDNTAIIWAIYYARVTDEVKRQLLMKHFSFDGIDALLEVCNRLDYPSVLEFALDAAHRR
ncbi:MAG: hypothetical protein CEE40_04675 [Chloroflexi bacterium B3_Chlor]|nr:MAG: hypothetical protein CEE40_04675 [Chloroflexi bacterium B3_Chlor]